MLLAPKKPRYQKQHSRNDGVKSMNKLDNLNLGCFGLHVEESGKIGAKQIEAVRLVLRRLLKRDAKI